MHERTGRTRAGRAGLNERGPIAPSLFASRQELATLLHITQPRLTQILNLTYLAPDIQAALLELPRCARGRDPIHERMLRPIVALTSWRAQRAMWRQLSASTPTMTP